jgi:hypothetical protein
MRPPTGEWQTAGCALSRTPQVARMGTETMPVTPPALGAAMARIAEGGRAAYAHSYAGLEVDQRLVRAVVYRVPAADFDDFIRHSAGDTCVVIRDAAHSLAELTEWQDRITTDLPEWTARGVRIFTVGARHDGVGVEVGTPDVAGVRRELSARYGPDAPLTFVERGPIRRLPTAGRPDMPRPGG